MYLHNCYRRANPNEWKEIIQDLSDNSQAHVRPMVISGLSSMYMYFKFKHSFSQVKQTALPESTCTIIDNTLNSYMYLYMSTAAGSKDQNSNATYPKPQRRE